MLEMGSTGRRESVTTTKIGDFGVILGGHFRVFLRCAGILGGRVRVILGEMVVQWEYGGVTGTGWAWVILWLYSWCWEAWRGCGHGLKGRFAVVSMVRGALRGHGHGLWARAGGMGGCAACPVGEPRAIH